MVSGHLHYKTFIFANRNVPSKMGAPRWDFLGGGRKELTDLHRSLLFFSFFTDFKYHAQDVPATRLPRPPRPTTA